MRIELLESGCLKVFLSDLDLRDRGLTFARLDYHNEETRLAVRRLLEQAHRETGFRPAGEMTMEAIPVEGGCLVLLTPVTPRRRVRMKRAIGPYGYRVEDVDGLFRLAEGWARMSAAGQDDPVGSSLYACAGEYRLILYPCAPLSPERETLLREFAEPLGEGDGLAAYTAEHGRALAVGGALERLYAACAAASPNGTTPLTPTPESAPAPIAPADPVPIRANE